MPSGGMARLQESAAMTWPTKYHGKVTGEKKLNAQGTARLAGDALAGRGGQELHGLGAHQLLANLPDECLVHIFSHLNPRSLVTASQVCRRWQQILNDEASWKLAFERWYALEAEASCDVASSSSLPWTRIDRTSWRGEYITRTNLLRQWKRARMPASHTSVLDARLPIESVLGERLAGPSTSIITDLYADFQRGHVLTASHATGFITRCEPFGALLRDHKGRRITSTKGAKVVASAAEALMPGAFHPAALTDLGALPFDALRLDSQEILGSCQGQLVSIALAKGGTQALSAKIGARQDDAIHSITVCSHGHGTASDSYKIITGSRSGWVRIWDRSRTEPLKAWDAALDCATTVTDGRSIVTLSWSHGILAVGFDFGGIVVYKDVNEHWMTGTALGEEGHKPRTFCTIGSETRRPISEMVISSRDSFLVAYTKGATDFLRISLSDRDEGVLPHTRAYGSGAQSVALTAFATNGKGDAWSHSSRDLPRAATGDLDGVVFIYGLSTDSDACGSEKPIRRLDVQSGLSTPISALCMTSLVLVAGHRDGRIRVFEPLSGALMRSWNERQGRLSARRQATSPSSEETSIEADTDQFAVRAIHADLTRCVAAVGTKVQAWDFSLQSSPKNASRRHRLSATQTSLKNGSAMPKASHAHDLRNDMIDYEGELAAEKANASAATRRAALFNLGRPDADLAHLTEAEMVQYAMMLSRDEHASDRIRATYGLAENVYEEVYDDNDGALSSTSSRSSSRYSERQNGENDGLHYSEFGFGTGSWRRKPSDKDSRIQVSPRPSPLLQPVQSPDSPSLWKNNGRNSPSPSLLSISPASIDPAERSLHWPMPNESVGKARRGSRSTRSSPRLDASPISAVRRVSDFALAGEEEAQTLELSQPRRQDKPKWSEVLQAGSPVAWTQLSQSPRTHSETAQMTRQRIDPRPVRPAPADLDDELQFVMQLSLAEANSRLDV